MRHSKFFSQKQICRFTAANTRHDKPTFLSWALDEVAEAEHEIILRAADTDSTVFDIRYPDVSSYNLATICCQVLVYRQTYKAYAHSPTDNSKREFKLASEFGQTTRLL